MKSLLLSAILAFSLPSAKSNENQTKLMYCRDNYFRIFSVEKSSNKINLRFEAAGFSERLEIADKLGFSPNSIFHTLDIQLREDNCSWDLDGRLSCISNNASLIFKNALNGKTEVQTNYFIKLNTGEVGIGSSSYRLVELNLQKDVNITDTHGFIYCSGELSR